MGFKQNYLDAAVDTILKAHPEYNEDEVRKIVSRIVKERMTDPTIVMDNNVTGENHRTNLSYLCSWIEKRNPVVSGNATFYCQPTELLSPTSNMLKSLKVGRKMVKKEMFKYAAGSDEYQALDLDQQNKKVIMNAEYGGSGTPTAAFYTKYSPAATTLMAQSIITTMAAFFESYVGDNQKFFHIDECIDWMNCVTSKKTDKVPKWVRIPSEKEVAHRIKLHFYMADVRTFPLIDKYVHGCTDTERVYLYYANNMKAFINDHHKISKLVSDILTTLPLLEASENEVPAEFRSKFPPQENGKDLEEYNKWVASEMFLDPYNIPKSIKDIVNELVDWLYQFVYVEYITPDSIVKLNNHMRNTVLLVDTDSNIINSNIFASFILDEVFPGSRFNRSRLYNEMILVNVLAAALDKCVKGMLDYYGRCHNMDEPSRAELTMKNEFMFRRFFLMKTKKRYAASIVLREGNMMLPFKLEIKGMDFIKAGVSDDVTKKYTNMLKNHILYPDSPELHEMMKEIKKFENDIYHDLIKGGTTFLKSQQYKPEEGYSKIKDSNGNVVGSKAWSLPVFRGAEVWNALNPDKRINSLDRVSIVKLIVTKVEDLDKIKDKFPKEYNDAVTKIFGSEDPNIRKAGLKVICIPNTVYQIPDWIIPLIDYDVIISDVISSFRSVLDSLKLEAMEFKTPNGKANLTSCLISL